MNFHFGGKEPESKFDLLPDGLLVWTQIHVQKIASSAAGGRYIALELTIMEGQPCAGRKVFETVMDPFFEGNSDDARDMGKRTMMRIFECNGARRDQPESYNLGSWELLEGWRAAVRIGTEKAKPNSGYEDKSRVKEWLSPWPDSSGAKNFARLAAGDHGVTAAAAAGRQGPAAAAAPAGFGQAQGPRQTVVPAQGGFGFPGGAAAAPAGKPTDQTPGWMKQAQS